MKQDEAVYKQPSCSHQGDPVRVGEFTIFAGGLQHFSEDLCECAGYDDVIPLLILPIHYSKILYRVVGKKRILQYCMEDFGGVEEDWEVFINRVLVPFLCEGKRMLVFCMGGHGRTGTVLAALKATLEPETEDPIAAVREAYCSKAVETDLQAKAIFALRGQKVPEKYERELIRAHR